MKKMSSILLGLVCLVVTSFGQSNSKVVLGVAPLLYKQTDVKDKYASEISGAIAEQASKIKELDFVSRSPDVLGKIAKEHIIQTTADYLNSAVLAEVGKELGATYLLIGEVSTVSIQPIVLGYKTLPIVKTRVPINGKLVTIVLNLQLVNVTTGKVEVAKVVSGDLTPHPVPNIPDDRAVADKISGMGSQFNSFLQVWYNEKTGTASTKAN